MTQNYEHYLSQRRLAIALRQDADELAFRISAENGFRYGSLHLGIFHIDACFDAVDEENIPLGNMPSIESLQKEVDKAAKARDKLLYATNNGIQTGFTNPEACLLRETQLSLGLIWATVDMYMHPGQDRPFINKVLEGMASMSTRK